ncbi:hypothetical protein TWF718_000308 [Orbilia javanica]|uniref:Uncharacterized protein n=1 Tax=Orbilia javanica TaxID=47235 RepID=A0AAN8P0Z5_9PEZI
MVASTLLSTILSAGLFGLQVSAGPIASSRLLTNLQPIRDSDLSSGTFRLNEFQRRSVEDSMDDAIELLPIREDDLIPPHLRKRSDDLSRLDLKENVRMIYGGVVSKNQIYMANMTLHQPDDSHPLIMMEKFDGLLKDVYCGTQSITLDFQHKDAMDYAIKTWDWVNQDSDDYFFLIANHPGCGEETQRNPYRVGKVKYDEEKLRTVLTTESIEWNTLASDFDISLGSAALTKRVSKRELKSSDLTKRGFFDIFTNFDFSKSVYWDLTVGDKTTRKHMMSGPFQNYGKVDISCAGCRLSGGLQVTGYVKVVKFAVKELYIAAKPKDLRGTVGLEAYISAAIPPGLVKVDATLFSLGIPGLSIPKIFLLGPSLQYEVGASFGAAGFANFTVGATATIPNNAALYADLLDISKSDANGFEATTIDPFFSFNQIGLTASASAYSRPVVAFGVKVLDRIGVECALELSLPMLNANLKAGYNKEGFCPDDPKPDNKGITTGIKASSDANIELWFKAGKYSGIPSIIPLPSFNKRLWGAGWPIGDFCFPIALSNPGPVIPDEPTPNRPAGMIDAPAGSM